MLKGHGISVYSSRTVGDRKDQILDALGAAAREADLVFITGGLGPTSDDLTRDVLAEYCAVASVQDEAALDRLRAKFAKRGSVVSETNLRQSFFPQGASVLENDWGTADAFRVENKQGVSIIALPGVPRELRPIVEQRVQPWLRKRTGERDPLRVEAFRIFGLPESEIASRIELLGLSSEIEVAYRASFPDVTVKLSLSRQRITDTKILDEAVSCVSSALGDFVFSRELQVGLSEVVVRMLSSQGKRLAIAESCTGGRIVDKIVSVPGASQALEASLVTYSNSAKEVFLGVPPVVLEGDGAVSKRVAEAMARGARLRSGGDIGLATTGIAGPGGGSAEKPVGAVWIALSDAQTEESHYYVITREREQFRQYASHLALDLLRRFLLRK